MNCCDEAGRCTGQKDCAIRSASEQPIRPYTKRRYRAGQPAEIPMPTLPIDVARPDKDRVTTVDIVMAGACIVLVLFILAVTLDTVGWI